MALVLSNAPSVEPLSTTEGKAQSRVLISADDTLIASYVKAARMHVENILNRALITQTWDYYLDQFPFGGDWRFSSVINVPKGQLQSVTSITYDDTNGDNQTLSSSLYEVDTKTDPARIVPAFGETWPVVQGQPNGVKIILVMGYGDAGSDVPEDIRQAMRFIMAHYYENREAVVTGTQVNKIPDAAEVLLEPYKIRRF